MEGFPGVRCLAELEAARRPGLDTCGLRGGQKKEARFYIQQASRWRAEPVTHSVLHALSVARGFQKTVTEV